MRDFLTALLECSATMSALALVYLALTPLLAKRYSAKWLYYAWLVIVVGLIVPFRIHTGAPLVAVNAAPVFSVPQAAGSAAVTVVTGGTVPAAARAAAKPFPWVEFLFFLWLAGAAAFLAFHAARHLRFLRMMKRWGEPADGQRTLEALQAAKGRLGIAAPVALRICPSVSSPMTTGFAKPVILLPRDDFSSEELSYIFLHELVHWKRKDLWYKGLVVLATAIHWFNPVVYFAARAISSLCELSCDAEVVARAGTDERLHYGEAILGAIGKRPGVQTTFSTNFNGGKRDMKKRIASIMDTKAKKAGLAVLCAVIVGTAATGAVFAANGKPAGAQSTPFQSSGEISVRTVAAQWAEAIKKRDADAQCALLSKKCRAHGYMADLSGPQIESYDVSAQGTGAVIAYHCAASGGSAGDYRQTLAFVREDGVYKIDSFSSLEPTAKPAASAVELPVRAVAQQWAEAVKSRSADAQYDLLSEKCRSGGYKLYSGASSQWVQGYEIAVTGPGSAEITYHFAASNGTANDYVQTLTAAMENGVCKIDSVSGLKPAVPAGSAAENPVYAAAAKWAEAIANRDGRAQYDLMDAKMRAGAYASFSAEGWKTGCSSPWVESYQISVSGESASVTFRYASSTGFDGYYAQTLSFVRENGAYKIDRISDPKEVTVVSEEKMKEYEKLQSSVDEGHRPGLTQPEEVAMEFASGTLKIANLSKTYDKIEKSAADGRSDVTFLKDGNPVLKFELFQPVKKGNGGIWAVASWVDGKTFESHEVS